jgi:peroxiredoxin
MHARTHPVSGRPRWTPVALLLLGAAVGLVAWQLTLRSVRRPPLDVFPHSLDWAPLTTAEAVLHPEAAAAACARQLQEIGRALARYQRDQHRLPDRLSDLVPRYLPDRSVLHCPADPTRGAPGWPNLHKDPRLPCSYSYEAGTDLCRRVAYPLGPIPTSDIADTEYPWLPNWGTCRHVSAYQQTFYGGWVPVVRCLHHPGADDEDWVRNLSCDGHLYASAPGEDWRNRPEVIRVALTQFERDLAAGPATLQRRWDLGQLWQYVDGWERGGMEARLRAQQPRLRSVAQRLLAVGPRLPAGGQRLADDVAAELYLLAGDYRRAQAVLQAAHRLPSNEPAPDAREGWIGAGVDRGLGEREKEIALLQQSRADPFLGKSLTPAAMRSIAMTTDWRGVVPPAIPRIAAAEEALDRPGRAEIYRILAEPSRGLIGQSAPEFTLSTAAGRRVSLRSARSGKRAVLLAFWAAGDRGCEAELPHLEKLHAELRGKGFALIAIGSPGDGGVATAFQFRPAPGELAAPIDLLSGSNDVAQSYHVQQHPTLFLLNAADRIIWTAAGFHRSDLAALRGALTRLGLPLDVPPLPVLGLAGIHRQASGR